MVVREEKERRDEEFSAPIIKNAECAERERFCGEGARGMGRREWSREFTRNDSA